MVATYGLLAERILTEYYKQTPVDSQNYTVRHICQWIATEQAMAAKANAIENSNLGEATFANDQFITTYYGIAQQTDAATGNSYVAMPSTPGGLPKNREIAYVGFSGNKKVQVIPMSNKDLFMQQFTKTPSWMVLYYIENGNVVFYNKPPLLKAPVDLKLVGAMPAGVDFVDSPLNIPKDYESVIFDTILKRLVAQRGVITDSINDNISQ